MSEISKARDRMFNRRGTSYQPQDRHSSTERQYPRKFTVSSLTHNLEHRPSQPQMGIPSLTVRQPPSSPSPSQFSSFPARSKENSTPTLLKTVNIKISQISHLQSSQPLQSGLMSTQQMKQYNSMMESRFEESPQKVQYYRPLHSQKMELVFVPPQERRHHSPYKPKETLKEYAEEIVASARAQDRPFTDQMFPPARTIVFSRKLLYQQQGLKFQRLSRIYNIEPSLFSSCEPTYLSLGKYTNPYLYSAVAMLAEYPSRVMSLFSGQKYNEDGVYHINLCKDGVWRYIVIDDFVPIKSIAGRKQMLFLHSRQNQEGVQLWPGLIQKAVAKIYGTYLDLAMLRDDGMADLFKLLTGAPTSVYKLNKDFRSYLILIDTALKRNHIVTLEAVHEEHAETAKIRNLGLNQAYRVTDIRKSGLKLRNYAQPQLSTKLSFGQCLIFSRLVIYRVEAPSYRYITHKLRHKRSFFSKLSLTVPVTTRGYLDIWQNNPAYYKKHLGSNIDYQLSRTRMLLLRKDQQDSQQGQWIENGKEVYLDAGIYELRIHLCQEKEYDFTVGYYGEKDVVMERVKCMEKWKEPCLCIMK